VIVEKKDIHDFTINKQNKIIFPQISMIKKTAFVLAILPVVAMTMLGTLLNWTRK